MTVCVFAASHPNSSLGTGSLEGVGLRMSADPSCTSAAGFLVEGTQFLGWLQQELGINKAIGTQLWERMSWQRDVINSQRAFEMRYPALAVCGALHLEDILRASTRLPTLWACVPVCACFTAGLASSVPVNHELG